MLASVHLAEVVCRNKLLFAKQTANFWFSLQGFVLRLRITLVEPSNEPAEQAFARLGGLIEWFRIWLRPARAMLSRRLAGELICEKVQTQSLQSQRRENHFSDRLPKPGVKEIHDWVSYLLQPVASGVVSQVPRGENDLLREITQTEALILGEITQR